MKTLLIYIAVWGITSLWALGQKVESPEIIIQGGDSHFRKGEYLEAVHCYRSAYRDCTRSEHAEIVRQKIESLFAHIYSRFSHNEEKIESFRLENSTLIQSLAEKDSIVKLLSEENVRLLKEKSAILTEIDSLRIVLNEHQRSHSQLEGAFFFYSDSIALSCNSSGRFGYVAKDGALIQDYVFKWAEVFDSPGYAKAISVDDEKFLVDLAMHRIPAAFSECELKPNTKAIDLRGNKLSRLPRRIYEHEHLNILLLSNNKLDNLPLGLKSRNNIEVLDLSQNCFVEFPAQAIFKMPNLKQLYLAGNSCVSGLTDRETILREMKKHLPNCQVHF